MLSLKIWYIVKTHRDLPLVMEVDILCSVQLPLTWNDKYIPQCHSCLICILILCKENGTRSSLTWKQVLWNIHSDKKNILMCFLHHFCQMYWRLWVQKTTNINKKRSVAAHTHDKLTAVYVCFSCLGHVKRNLIFSLVWPLPWDYRGHGWKLATVITQLLPSFSISLCGTTQ